jgi:hypothetical protein
MQYSQHHPALALTTSENHLSHASLLIAIFIVLNGEFVLSADGWRET